MHTRQEVFNGTTQFLLPRKYYWVLFVTGNRPYEDCIAEHPFEFIHKLNRKSDESFSASYYHLENWKQIEVEEYNCWQVLKGK